MKAFDQLTERGQHQRRRRLAEAALATFGIKAEELKFINHGENTTYRVKQRVLMARATVFTALAPICCVCMASTTTAQATLIRSCNGSKP